MFTANNVSGKRKTKMLEIYIYNNNQAKEGETVIRVYARAMCL